jgi:hypothetical protein
VRATCWVKAALESGNLYRIEQNAAPSRIIGAPVDGQIFAALGKRALLIARYCPPRGPMDSKPGGPNLAFVNRLASVFLTARRRLTNRGSRRANA